MTAAGELDGDVLVVDGFYADPHAVRRLALGAEYRDFGDRANFPGVESVKAYATSGHAARFADIVGRPIEHDPARWVFGKFRLATARSGGRTRVHLDKVDWTAVVYLSVDDRADTGLAFYEHVATGLRRVPAAGELREVGWADLDAFDRDVVVPDTLAEEKWARIHDVPMRFNRCVVFRGARRFHAIAGTFGDDLASGRLTQNFFFMEAPT